MVVFDSALVTDLVRVGQRLGAGEGVGKDRARGYVTGNPVEPVSWQSAAIPVRQRSRRIAPACAHRGCGRSRSGCPMCGHPPFAPRRIASRGLWVTAARPQTIRRSSLPCRTLGGSDDWHEAGGVWTVAGGTNYAGKPGPVLIVHDDSFDGTASSTICAFSESALCEATTARHREA